MYGELFDIPTPDETVYLSTFEGREVFRSGVTYTRGLGRVFYFSPGDQEFPVLVEGRATGLLIGGNLSSITHMVGAGLPSLDGTILLLEAKRDMGLGRIDRQITQLKRAGALDNLAGLALGLFSGFDDYEDRGWTLVDVLKDHLEPLGIPVLGGLKIGHNGIGADGRPNQTCVKLGAPATIDTAAGKLTSG
jgi:muramoyltetrapeptide carboxypeptidase